MGLTIHWPLKSSLGSRGNLARLGELRSACLDLPFETVGEVVHLRAEDIRQIRDDREHPLSWALIQAEESITVEKIGNCTRWLRVPPEELIGLSTWPGEGCEEANFFLGRFPASIGYEGRLVPTGFSDWTGCSFCKTQYASNVSIPHFLRCHVTVIAALDRAKQLGLCERVSDEGDFWKARDLAALSREVGDWNEMIAGLAAALGGAGVAAISSIAEHPDFAALQEAGLKKPNTAACAKKLAEIARRLSPKPSTPTG